MGYFISMTWPWWLLAIALAVAITWLVFRDRKHTRRDQHARGERAVNVDAATDAELRRDRDRGRDRDLAREREYELRESRDLNVPSQSSSLKERAEEVKAKAEKSGRKFF